MSNLLKEKQALAKQKEELERKKGKLYRSCKGFRHLAQNCRNKKEGEKGTTAPQNKFKVLSSRVMQYRVEKRVVRRQEVVGVECFKCGEKRHKCRECPMWKRIEKRGVEKAVCVAKPQKVQQKELRRAKES